MKILIALGWKDHYYINIFLTDLFFMINNIDITRYADNTPYVVPNNIVDLIKSLEQATATLFQWFLMS